MDWSQTDALASSRRRNSSKLSLGSTPSSPISTDAVDDDDGDAPLTPTERLVDDEDEDDAMLSLNGVLSEDEKEYDDNDDRGLRNSSPSTLSSVPDDFPLSQSASPISDPQPYTDNQDGNVNNKAENEEGPSEIPAEEEKTSQEDEPEDEEEESQKPPPRRRTRARRTGTGRRTRKRKVVYEEPEEPEEPSVIEERKPRNRRGSIKSNVDNDGESDSGSGRGQRKRPKVNPDEVDDDTEAEKDIDAEMGLNQVAPEEDNNEDSSQPMTSIKEEDEDEVAGVPEESSSAIDQSKINESNEDEVATDQHNDDDNEDDQKPDDVESASVMVEGEDHRSIAANADDEESEDQVSQPDDQEYQKTHQEALIALTHIEVEFARLRETMYQEKMAELREEMTLIADGTHPELMSLMEEIETKKRKRMDTAAAWCKYQQLNYRRQYEGFEYQANVHFIHKRNALRRDMINGLNDKRWKLDEERAKITELVPLIGVLPDRPVLIRHKKLQKAEATELRQLQNAIGFPLAPKVFGLAKKDMEEDLEALGLTQKATNSKTVNQNSLHPTATLDSGASEQYVPQPDASKGESTQVVSDINHFGYQNGSNVITPHTNNPVYIQQGKLQYHNHTFNKGDHFTVVDVNAGRYSAKLLVAQDTEILIQRTDGSKTKLPLAMICEGKYQISTKS